MLENLFTPERIGVYLAAFAAGAFAFLRLLEWLEKRVERDVAKYVDSGATRDRIAKMVADEVDAKIALERQRIVEDAVEGAERRARQVAGERAIREDLPRDPAEAGRRARDLLKKPEPPG